MEYKPYKKTGLSVGIDTGIKDLAILSDGKIYKNIKTLKTNLKKLKYNQRQLSKKQKELLKEFDGAKKRGIF